MTVKYNPVGDRDPDRAVDGRPGRQPARPRGGRRSRDSCATSSRQNALKPLDFAESTINDNFSEGAVEAGTVDGKLYGLLFKAANKSTVWYNVPLFEEAGVRAAGGLQRVPRGGQDAEGIRHAAYSIGASDGWTLTDLFENIYLRQAGPEKYDQLADARHPVDRPVGEGRARDDGADRRRHGQHRGRHLGRARDGLPDVGHQRVQGQPRRRAGDRGRLRGERDHRLHAGRAGDGLQRLRLPGHRRLRAHRWSVAATRSSCSTTRRQRRRWSSTSRRPRRRRSGRSGAATRARTRTCDDAAYEDPLLRETATAIADAETFRFDLSDLQPAAFGATVGQGLWKEFQDFLRNPDDVDGAAQAMEQSAARAF